MTERSQLEAWPVVSVHRVWMESLFVVVCENVGELVRRGSRGPPSAARPPQALGAAFRPGLLSSLVWEADALHQVGPG